jgi:hypothetical protein
VDIDDDAREIARIGEQLMDPELTESQHRPEHILDRATQDNRRKRAAVRSIDDHISVEHKVGDEMCPGKPEKASDLSPSRLHKIDQVSPCALRDFAHARRVPDSLVLRRASHVITEGHVRATVEEAFDNCLDVRGVRGRPLCGIPEPAAAHIDFHEHAIAASDQGCE